MPSRSSAFSHLLAPGLWEATFNKYSQYPTEYDKVFNVRTSKRAYEEDSEISGLGKLVSKGEGLPVTYDDPFQAASLYRYTMQPYALGVRITHELYVDDLYNIMNRIPSALSRSAHQTEEVLAWNIFNFGFNAGYVGRDGQPLFSTAHPNIAVGAGSGPYSNRLSTDLDLSITSLEAAVELMETTTDDRDLNLMIKPALVVCTPHLKWLARELLNSEYKPHTADNEINPLADEDLKYLVCHYMASNDPWFLVSSKDQHYLNFWWREKMSMDNDDDFDTGDAKFKAYERMTAGFSGWRGIVGTPGSGTF